MPRWHFNSDEGYVLKDVNAKDHKLYRLAIVGILGLLDQGLTDTTEFA